MTRDVVWWIIAVILVVQVISLFVQLSVLNILKSSNNPEGKKQQKPRIENPSFKDMR